MESRYLALQADSLPAETQGKPKNTGVGSVSLLQWIFLTQASNRGSPALQMDYLHSLPLLRLGQELLIGCGSQDWTTVSLFSMKVKVKVVSRVQLFATLWAIQSMEFSRPEQCEVGRLSLLQGIIPTQGSNPGLQRCRRILYQLSQKGSPRKLEWVAYPFSRGSSRPRNELSYLKS